MQGEQIRFLNLQKAKESVHCIPIGQEGVCTVFLLDKRECALYSY